MEVHNIAIAVASERYQTLAKIQRMLRSSQKPLRQIALESGVTCGTICMIAKGGAVKVSTARRLAEKWQRSGVSRPADRSGPHGIGCGGGEF